MPNFFGETTTTTTTTSSLEMVSWTNTRSYGIVRKTNQNRGFFLSLSLCLKQIQHTSTHTHSKDELFSHCDMKCIIVFEEWWQIFFFVIVIVIVLEYGFSFNKTKSNVFEISSWKYNLQTNFKDSFLLYVVSLEIKWWSSLFTTIITKNIWSMFSF
jgi:hypothetical protein